MPDIKNTLSGMDNVRLNNVHPTNNEGTAAWVNTGEINNNNDVNIQMEDDVEEAKNWVDNGSIL